MELRIVVPPALPFELHRACFQRLVGQRERVLPGCGCHRGYVGINGEPIAFPHHYHQQRVRGVVAQRSRYWCPCVGQQVMPFERRPLAFAAVVADAYHAQRGNAESRNGPHPLLPRPAAPSFLPPPPFLHPTPPPPASP